MEAAITTRPMVFKEARECADRINANLSNIRQLVVELHDRDGWDALGYKDWTECVNREFKQGGNYIFKQFAAAQIEKNINDSVKNHCTTVQLGTIPERQLRPLSRLEPAQQREAWQQAVATAPDGKVTAAHVSKIVREMQPEVKKPVTQIPQSETGKPLPSYAIEFATTAISHLERISIDDPNREEAFRMIIKWLNNQRKGDK